MAGQTATVPQGAVAPGQAARAAARSGGTRATGRTYGALDLGTNNCRLLIARPDGYGGFTVVDAFSRIVRLGEGLAARGRISDEAIERAVEALRVCADKLVRRGVTLSRAVATEACRRADNGEAFVERVYRETGIALDIIDPGEEARLAVAGCHALLEPGDGPALIFDIGGGSTELVRVLPGANGVRMGHWRSVPWGVVTLAESEPHDVGDAQARLTAYEAMKGRVRDALDGFAGAVDIGEPAGLRLLGTSGTVTTLASVHLGLPSYDRRQVDGSRVPLEDMRGICRRLAAMSLDERAALPCIGRERAELVVAGCAVLDAILELWPAPRVGIADRGIREGILRALMASTIA